MPVLGRISSNKDHGAVYSGLAAPRKPRLAGIGKAPTRPRHISGKHDGKAVLRALRKASLRNDPRLPASLVAKAAPKPAPARKVATPVLTDKAVSVKGFVIRDDKGSVLRIPVYLPKHAIAPNPDMTMSDGTVVVSCLFGSPTQPPTLTHSPPSTSRTASHPSSTASTRSAATSSPARTSPRRPRPTRPWRTGCASRSPGACPT